MGGASGQGAGEEASRGEVSTEEELTEAVRKQGLGTLAQIGLGDGGVRSTWPSVQPQSSGFVASTGGSMRSGRDSMKRSVSCGREIRNPRR